MTPALRRYLFWCLVIAISFFAAFQLANPIGLTLLGAAAVYVGYSLACMPFRSKPCMVCGGKSAFMMPKTHVPWWHMGPHRSDVSWICEDHLDTFLRLVVKTGKL